LLNQKQFLLVLATHVTLPEVHPRVFTASMAVQDVAKHAAHPMRARGESGTTRAGLFIAFCVDDTNVAGLDDDGSLKLELRSLQRPIKSQFNKPI